MQKIEVREMEVKCQVRSQWIKVEAEAEAEVVVLMLIVLVLVMVYHCRRWEESKAIQVNFIKATQQTSSSSRVTVGVGCCVCCMDV